MVKRGAILSVAMGVVSSMLAGCSGDVLVPDQGPPIDWHPMRIGGSSASKVDVLFVIDNSGSMADKQAVLKTAVPDMVRSLLNPACVDVKTQFPTASQPAGPLDPCPEPLSRRMFPPMSDVHIGVLSSSLGGHGSDACLGTGSPSACPGGVNPAEDDKGHLVTRTGPCGGTAPTYQNKGFLAWDPGGVLSPPGEGSLGSSGLSGAIADLVGGAGQNGCGYESQLESWYRFLVEPKPSATITLSASGVAVPSGVDTTLLQQRKDFLRPDSLLSIVVISDENDCSIRESGMAYLAAQQHDPKSPGAPFHLPPARSECAVDPGDHCCHSCAEAPPDCPPDPACAQGPLDPVADDVGLRCWDMKRRFGVDFLYPINRYVNGLTQALVSDSAGNLVDNPIFSDLDASDGLAATRNPGLVFFTAIVGVPWQDLARDPADAKKGFKSSHDLDQQNANAVSGWDVILGDPENHVAPHDPHMIESRAPRTGIGIEGPSTIPLGDAPSSWPDPLSGHERTPSVGAPLAADDVGLQYACIFPLAEPRDCSKGGASCDCADPQNDSPLCEANPADMGARTLQRRAKAYPGIRQLSLVRALGPQGVPQSICPVQLADPSAGNFGYRAALGPLFQRLQVALGGQCLARPFATDAQGQIACLVLEARVTAGKHAKDCASFCDGLPGRRAVPAEYAREAEAALSDTASEGQADCVCEVVQLAGSATTNCADVDSPLAACQCQDAPVLGGKQVHGWCYVDGESSPPLGNPDVTASCTEGERRLLRFVGDANPAQGATVFINCPTP